MAGAYGKTKCPGTNCSQKEACQRFTSKGLGWCEQWRTDFSRSIKNEKCEYFISNKPSEIGNT